MLVLTLLPLAGPGQAWHLASDGYLGCVLYRWIFLEQAVCGREKS